MPRYSYNLHDLINIESDLKVFDRLFSYFRASGPLNQGIPSMTVKSELIVLDTEVMKGTGTSWYYEEARDGVYLQYPWLVPFRALVTGISQKDTLIYVTPLYRLFGNLARRVFNLLEIFKALLAVKLLRQGCVLLHSACVDFLGQGVLLPAFSYTEKTITSLVASKVSGDFRYLSNELVLIKDFKALPFPSACAASLETIKAIGKRLSLEELIELYTKNMIASLVSGRRAQPYLNILPTQLLERHQIAGSTKIEAIFFLEKGFEEVREVNRDEAKRKLINLNAHEVPWHSNPILQAYSYLSGKFDGEALMAEEGRLLGKLVDNARRCFVMSSSRDHSALLLKVERFM